jgi:hypothetical protein
MAESESGVEKTSESGPPPQVAVPVNNIKVLADIPVVFADAVASQAWTANLSKFYFSRTDSDPRAQAPNTEVYVAQIVMPNNGFVMAVAFLEHRMKMMVEAGVISQELVDKSREFWLTAKT